MNTTSGKASTFAFSAPSSPLGATKTRIYAHRGASAVEPENSLPAFVRARADGADGVELDVRLCASGDLFVFHDKDLRRLGGRRDRFDALDYAQVRSLRLTSGVGVPSLPEVFEAVGPDMIVNVELKTDALVSRSTPRLLAAVAKTLQVVARPERVILSSFNPLAVAGAAVMMPKIARALLFESDGPVWARGQRLTPFMPLQAVHPQNHLCTAKALRGWKAHGFAVNVWTVDDPARQRELASWGVDGIITNNPAAARANLNER